VFVVLMLLRHQLPRFFLSKRIRLRSMLHLSLCTVQHQLFLVFVMVTLSRH
jgi:hypothetical protein